LGGLFFLLASGKQAAQFLNRFIQLSDTFWSSVSHDTLYYIKRK